MKSNKLTKILLKLHTSRCHKLEGVKISEILKYGNDVCYCADNGNNHLHDGDLFTLIPG